MATKEQRVLLSLLESIRTDIHAKEKAVKKLKDQEAALINILRGALDYTGELPRVGL